MTAHRREVHWDRVVACYPDRAAAQGVRLAAVAADQPEAIVVVEGDLCLFYADLLVSAEGALSPGAVSAWCEARLSDYKVPRDVVVEAAALPRNANGKIQKALRRERAAALGEVAA